jgi:hypothetical protein
MVAEPGRDALRRVTRCRRRSKRHRPDQIKRARPDRGDYERARLGHAVAFDGTGVFPGNRRALLLLEAEHMFGEQFGEQIEENRPAPSRRKPNESGPPRLSDTRLGRLWSRRSRVRVPSLTPLRSPANAGFFSFRRRRADCAVARQGHVKSARIRLADGRRGREREGALHDHEPRHDRHDVRHLLGARHARRPRRGGNPDERLPRTPRGERPTLTAVG